MWCPMRIASLAVVAAIVSSASVALADAPVKIGVVDVQKAVRTVPDGKAAKAKLESEAKAKQSSLNRQQDELKKMKDDLEKQASLLKDEVKRQKYRDYQQKLIELQDAALKGQNDLKEQEDKLLKPIFEKLKKTIDKVAKEKGYTLVVEQTGVLFAVPEMDITDLVIQRYGK